MRNRKSLSCKTDCAHADSFGLTDYAVGQDFSGSTAATEPGMSYKIANDEAIRCLSTKFAQCVAFQHIVDQSTVDDARAIDLLNKHDELKYDYVAEVLDLIFTHHPRVAAHSRRVGSLCRKIALSMGLSQNEAREVGVAGLLHDIGKLYIDEELLDKPGALDNPEWSIVRAHSEKGRDILAAVPSLSFLADCVLEHHEWWNGKGYPCGLKGEGISLFARIIAVADAYDAMTSERCYRQQFDQEEAVAELQRFAGTQFDPAIVRVLAEKVLATEN